VIRRKPEEGGIMARSAAIVTTWAQPRQGREGKALESFTDFLVFWGKLAADGKCEAPEPFFSYDGGKGFAVVRGKSDVLSELFESEEYEKLLAKAQLTVDDLHTEMYVTGDDEIQRGTRIYAEAAHELGYL
jgi:hypothetical protein